MSDDVMYPPASVRSGRDDEELPDPALFWRWAGHAARPWAGWILAAVGVIVIVVGWFGVSGQALVAKQLPYLISGGLGGVALVGIGAAMISAERRRQDTGRIERLEEMVGELRAVLLTHPDAPPDWEERAAPGSGRSPAGRSTNGTEPPDGELVAIPTGTTFHSPGCQMVRGKDGVRAVTTRVIGERGLSACRVCEPRVPAG